MKPLPVRAHPLAPLAAADLERRSPGPTLGAAWALLAPAAPLSTAELGTFLDFVAPVAVSGVARGSLWRRARGLP